MGTGGCRASRRVRLPLALAGCLVAAGTVQAGAAPAPVTLAGTTHVSATAGAASTVVRLPRDVTLDGQCYGEKTVGVSGSADAVLLAMHPLGGGEPQQFGRFPERQGRATFSSLCGGRSTLAAGTYRLVLLKSAGTATVTLRLPGLTGTAKVSPRTPSSASLVDLPAISAYETASGVVGSFGDTRELTSQGALTVAAWVDTDLSAVVTMGSCDKKREATQDELANARDFAPGCPTGGSSSTVPGPRGAGMSYFASTYSGIDAASWGSGFYYVSQSPVKNVGALAAWIPFEG